MKERLDKLGAEPFTMSSAAFDKFIVDETAKAQQIVKAAGIKVELTPRVSNQFGVFRDVCAGDHLGLSGRFLTRSHPLPSAHRRRAQQDGSTHRNRHDRP